MVLDLGVDFALVGTVDNTVDVTVNTVVDVAEVITLNVVTALLLRTSDAARFEGTLDNTVGASVNTCVEVAEDMVGERLYSNVVLCLPNETLFEDNIILLTVVLAELP